MSMRAPLVSIGYEGRDVDALVEHLLAEDVKILVDVRLTPLSRKSGLSKTKLAARLAESGIGYIHLRALGNPKDNRDRLRSGAAEAFARYREVIANADGVAAIDHVVELMDEGAVALLCFERDHSTCHRNLVVEAVIHASGSELDVRHV